MIECMFQCDFVKITGEQMYLTELFMIFHKASDAVQFQQQFTGRATVLAHQKCICEV